MENDEIITRPISDFLVDIENPRLPQYVERDEKAIVTYIAKHTSIEELITAIGENGYFHGEPVITYQNDDGKYVVVEGNRRLTAV